MLLWLQLNQKSTVYIVTKLLPLEAFLVENTTMMELLEKNDKVLITISEFAPIILIGPRMRSNFHIKRNINNTHNLCANKLEPRIEVKPTCTNGLN